MSPAAQDPAAFPDLLYSDAERALADSLRSLLADRGGTDKALARIESPQTYDDDLWHAVAAEVGCAGLLIPERDGGAGASYREAAAAAEALAGFVAPVPFLGSAVVATTALLGAAVGTAASQDTPFTPARAAADLLRRMADGSVTAALAVPFATAPAAGFPTSVRVAGPRPGDAAAGLARLRGMVSGVADALPASVLIVPAEGVPNALYLVDMSSPGVSKAPVTSLDMTRQLCDLSFDDAPGTMIASGPAAVNAVAAALAAGFTAAPRGAFPAAVRVAGSRPGDVQSGVSRLRGMVSGVADALPATVLLVPADGVPSALYLVDVSAEGVAKAPVVSLDMTRQLCDLSFDDAPGTLIASGAAATRAVGAALTAGAAILAAEQVGLAQRCLDMTVAYVKQRHQFARPVGSFQALKHRLADVWVGVTQGRAASRYAAACLAAGHPDADVAVAVAQAYCSDVAVHAAQECVQMHGGIGFTWEHPAHLYLKRAKADSIGFGTADAHRAALASLVNLPA